MSEKIKNNWYKILELEYYPNPMEDEEVIRDRIEDKKAFWVKKRNDFSKGKEYTKYLELENKKVIEEEMLDPENNKRKEMIRELQNILFKAVDDMLEFCEGEYISSKVVKEFSKQEGLDEKLIKIRLKEKGKRIEEYRNPIYENYCENLKKKITNYDNSKKNLDLLGKKNLYDFLNSEGIYCQSETDTEKILEKIEERRKKLVKSDAETSAKKELLSECHLIFKNAQKKREYDEYVEHLKYLEVSKELEKLKILSENSDLLNLSNRSFKYLKKIEEILRNKEEAKSIFVGFCRAERIPYDIQENQKNQSQNQNQNQSKKENERKNQSSTGSQSQQRNTGQNQNNNGNNRNSDNRSSNNRNDNNNNWKSDTKKKKSGGAAFVWVIVAMLAIVIAVLAISKKDNQRQENSSVNTQNSVQSDKPKEPEKSDEGNSNEVTEGGNTEQSNNDVVDKQNNNTDDENTQDSADLSEDTEFIANGTAQLIDDRGEEVDVEIGGNMDGYTTLVIKNLKRSRYRKMMSHSESGNLVPLEGRIFKFRCGEHATVENGKLVVDAEDVASYRSQHFVNIDTNLRDGKCITAPGSKVNKEMDTSDID